MKLNKPLPHLTVCGLLCFFALQPLVTAQTVIPPGFAKPAGDADTNAPGFNVRTVQAAAAGTLPNSLERTENQLAGLLIDPATGEPYANIADLTLFADDGYYHEETVIDYEQGGGSGSGLLIPGIPGTQGGTDNLAMEALTYLVLQPGTYTMVVNSDDGFRVTAAADPRDAFESVTLGSFDGGRGAGDTTFQFSVTAAGAYGFRLIYQEGSSGANVSWFIDNPADPGARILVNDPNEASSIKAFRSLKTPQAAYVDVASPTPGAVDVAARPTLTYRIVDGGSSPVAPGSVQLFLDGTPVTATISKNGNKTTVTYPLTSNLVNASVHAVKLVFSNTAVPPTVTTKEATFTVLNYANLLLPNPPIVAENFDSWAEQTTPPDGLPSEKWTYNGWTVEQYTSGGGTEWDLLNPNSDAYLGWVVVSRETIAGIGWDSTRRLNVAEQYVNNERIETLINGNCFYAESDVRSGSQVQYLFSPDFDLSGIDDVHLYYHSIYEQNQDSIGAVEYSINGGTTWLPIVYMIDGTDIVLNTEGKTDAEATLNKSHGDAAMYTDAESGEQIGGTFGAFIGAAPETWPTLGPFISGRVNDNAIESKRVEYFPLPQAARQAKVRFRFAQAGTASWYFGIDNFALYGTRSAVTEPAPVLSVSLDAGQVRLSWSASPAGYKLQGSSSLATGSWTNIPGATANGGQMTLLVPPTAPGAYYRLIK